MSLDVTLTPTGLDDARVTTTAAATMRTYAAPGGPGRASVAVWRTEMPPAAAGPLHTVSEDQVLVLLSGAVRATVGGVTYDLLRDQALVLPADVPRQIVAGPDGAVGLVSSLPGASAKVGDGAEVPVPWAS